ncbi:MAG: hypothetical protein GDYSWBUE_001826 [Candidatus Fervidibacterota bacterium]
MVFKLTKDSCVTIKVRSLIGLGQTAASALTQVGYH